MSSSLPKSLDRIKKIGYLQEPYEIEGVKFILKSINSKEHLDILLSTADVADGVSRLELVKRRTLEKVIVSVDDQQVDNEELLTYLLECNPQIINALFNKYLSIADKAAIDISNRIQKIELVDTNLDSNMIAGSLKTEASEG